MRQLQKFIFWRCDAWHCHKSRTDLWRESYLSVRNQTFSWCLRGSPPLFYSRQYCLVALTSLTIALDCILVFEEYNKPSPTITNFHTLQIFLSQFLSSSWSWLRIKRSLKTANLKSTNLNSSGFLSCSSSYFSERLWSCEEPTLQTSFGGSNHESGSHALMILVKKACLLAPDTKTRGT